MTRTVFLEIAIGDIDVYHRQEALYASACEWVTQWAPTYGLSSHCLADLSADERETVRDIMAADPTLKPWSVDQPTPLGGGRIVIELFEKDCPKTCENFEALTLGGRIGKSSKKPLHYKDTRFFRVVPNYMVQGGDVTRGDGSGGDSIFNGKFNDEKPGLAKKLTNKGTVAMANSGKNSNTSQFFITLVDSAVNPAQFDKIQGKYVVFGKVIEGLSILDELNNVKVDKERPLVDITITNCGSVA